MLTVLTPQEALDIILSNVSKTDACERLSLWDVQGRIAAHDIISGEDLPAFSRSCVDGLAVHAQDTYGSSEALPAMLRISGKILMGEEAEKCLDAGSCMEIPTGGMLPKGADSAVMVEYTEDIADGFRYVLKPCSPNENIVRRGDDCKAGDIVVKSGTVLEAKNIAVLAALGIGTVDVVSPIKVGVISTGDEIIDFKEKPQGAQIRDINSVTLASCIKRSGCNPVIYPIVPDKEEDLLNTLESAVKECDCVLVSGGSSVGEKDAVCRVISSLGDIRFHGIAIKPGKPTMFAVIDNVPVFGLPGHPAAAFFAFTQFVKPALQKMLGSIQKEICITAAVSQNIPSNHGRQETVAVKLVDCAAVPLFAKSGVVSVLSQADGYITIARDTEGILKGAEVEVTLF